MITRKIANTTRRQEVRPARKFRNSDEQIAAALGQAEICTHVVDIRRNLSISEAKVYVWKKRFGTLITAGIHQLRQLREENAKPKMVVANLTLDRSLLKDEIKKKGIAEFDAGAASRPKVLQLSERRACGIRSVNRRAVRYRSVRACGRRRCLAFSNQSDCCNSDSLLAAPNSLLAQTRGVESQYQAF